MTQTKILDGLKNSTPEQWKDAWEKARQQEETRDARLKERIKSAADQCLDPNKAG
jgi:hypothetical protein